MSDAYKEAGVDIEAGREAVERMKQHVARTMRPEVLTGLGAFGSLFHFDKDLFDEPVLVSGTDGVGTKLKVAFLLDKHDTIGVDCVAMVVNDIAAQGAEPLFFLDYFATGKLDPSVAEKVVSGIADGCELAGCALVGGETAEMPDLYSAGEYDLAGFAVGVVDRAKMIDGSVTRAGDVILGLASSGLHSNGFSLVRKLLFADRGWDATTKLRGLDGWKNSWADEATIIGELLLTPTRIYVPAVKVLQSSTVQIRGLAHITGGGLDENLPRTLGPNLCAEVERGSWDMPPIFRWLADLGDLTEDDLIKTFNCGIGMAVVVREEDVEAATEILEESGETVFQIGRVQSGEEGFRLSGAQNLVED
jgi:phosphoribosylformylglycinamidine cyclo-ligase